MASLVVSEHAIYSDSVVDSATMGGFLEHEDTAPPATKKTYPPVALRSCVSPAKSGSLKPGRVDHMRGGIA